MDQVLNANDAVWLDVDSCSMDDFRRHVEVETPTELVPLASDLSSNIPLYDSAAVKNSLDDRDGLMTLMAEWNRVLSSGPGIVVFRQAHDNPSLIDDVTAVLETIIAEEEAQAAGSGDHFAPAGANSRVWNAHEKLCIADPRLFALYNANPIIPLISRAWLGPHYQITTQVNVVRPGGKAQTCHRDYHMGFQTADDLARYPARVHELTPLLTLQGAIAHCDMPIESGPTKLLPYSQTYRPGFIATLQTEYRDYFEANCVQLPLEKGDALFFNPAVFHAAGENRSSDIHRFANLMQIGSGYGRSIEIVDRLRMSKAMYPVLLDLKQSGTIGASELGNVIAACAEGYPFPANLDIDSPLTGMAPESQQELLHRALGENWPADQFNHALQQQADRKRSH
ncbi:MAG: phytanoyl-CoA dioxygenase family protein [Alphaproteobacteria bacterium]|nr:phytanoyl-CoA dioxygenase family protein [Alphaproteobacteria bacterium]